MGRIIYCKYCGKPFEHSKVGNRKFCTPWTAKIDTTSCYYKYYNTGRVYKKKLLNKKICPECSNEFFFSGKKIYCSKICKNKFTWRKQGRNKEKQRKSYLRNKARGVWSRRNKKINKMRNILREQRCCVYCGNELKADELTNCVICRSKRSKLEKKKRVEKL